MNASAVAPSGPGLRADARRSIECILEAALAVFREHGLGAALSEVASRAGVSKGTIYHRFGGRQGLIDAVIDDLVAERIEGILRQAQSIEDPGEAFESYLHGLAMLQFDEPAANDVLLRAISNSARADAICQRSRDVATQILDTAQRAGAVRGDLSADDMFMLVWERGVIARTCDRQSRDDYERRLRFLLDGLSTPPAG